MREFDFTEETLSDRVDELEKRVEEIEDNLTNWIMLKIGTA